MTIDRKTDIKTQAKMEYLWLSYYNDSLYNMGVITEDERKNGFKGIRADKILEEMDKIIAEAEFKHEV